MDTNLKLIVELSKHVIAKEPDLNYLFSQLLIEAEKKKKDLNGKGTVESINWLIHESEYMNHPNFCDRSRATLHSLLFEELNQL